MTSAQQREHRSLELENRRLKDGVAAAESRLSEQRADLDFELAHQQQRRAAVPVHCSTPGRGGSRSEFNEQVSAIMAEKCCGVWTARRIAYERNPRAYGRWVSVGRYESRKAMLADAR